MKKSDQLTGFVKYEKTDYPFEFDESKFLLKLFPPNNKERNKSNSLDNLFCDSFSTKEHKWIENKHIQGINCDDNRILFCVTDNPSNNYGFLSYSVIWCVIYENGANINEIGGFRLSGEDVNRFYSPQNSLEYQMERYTESGKYKSMSVNAKDVETIKCGKYRVVPHTDALIEVYAAPTIHFRNYKNPIDSKSFFCVTFSNHLTIEQTINSYLEVDALFSYLTYRKNTDTTSAELFTVDNGKNHYIGWFIQKELENKESNKNANERIIGYNILKSKTAKLMPAFRDKKIGAGHLCESIDTAHSYSASRIIMILAEFEREFRNIYGVDYKRDQKYIDTKDEVVECIDQYRLSVGGKKRKYARQLMDFVKNRDNSFADNVKHALTDCQSIMEPFVQKKYNESFSENVDAISERMGIVRNSIAHSKLNFSFAAIHLCDISIIEELLYAMRLKHIAINTADCKIAINNLFHENFRFFR